MIAPIFPEAALMPCAVERYRVGNISPGMTKAVVFGPKPQKRFAKQTRTTSPGLEFVEPKTEHDEN